jgi:hypothetical protein
VDEHNHALAALRYLIGQLDAHHLARPRRPQPTGDAAPAADRPDPSRERRWLRLDNEALWTRIF